MGVPMFVVTIEGDKNVIAKFQRLTPTLAAAIYKEIQSLTLRLQRKVVQDHLSGPTGPNSLSRQSGALARSVFKRVEQTSTGVTGWVGYSADVPYAAIHEFGGIIHHPGGTPYFLDKNTGQAVFVSKSSPGADKLPVTKPHDIPIPERAPLRTAFNEMYPEIKQGLIDAVEEALKK